VFGLPEKFAQNPAELQKRFYEISRALHPDRFTTSDPASKQVSLERMSLVNEAYRTLRSPSELREYVLNLHGLKTDAAPKGQVPMELAESWFELQDVIAEDPSHAAGKIAAFRKELEALRASADAKIRAIEQDLDQKDSSSPNDPGDYQEGLVKLARAVHEVSYLISMARDVDRMAARG
jgi:molecular chaperone HscB